MSYKIGSICAIYGCNNYKQQKESKSFFRMPKDEDRYVRKDHVEILFNVY